jgi:predicted ATPase
MSDSASVAAVHKPPIGAKILEVTPSSLLVPIAGASSRQSSEEIPPFRHSMKTAPDEVPLVEETKLNSEIELYPDEPKVTADEKKEADDLQHKRASLVWREHLQEKLFHRSEEQASVVCCYEAMLSEPEASTFLLVTGPIGTGKTRLVKHALQQRVQDQGGYYLRGKFDQLRRPEPYRGFVSAFTEFTSQVVERGPEAVTAMSEAIYNAVGDECCVLISMIPALERILGDRKCDSNYSKADDAIQRFVFVFRMFMRAVSSREQPMVLLLDDLHWADPCSLDILSIIVTDLKNNQGLLVIGTCDGNDVMSNDSYMSRKLRELEKSGSATITQVSIQNLQQGEVNHFIGNALQLPRLEQAEDLGAIVIGQTNGNLFYIIEFIRWLQDSGLLLFDGESGSWVWDADEIRMTIDLCQVGDFLNDKLEQLPVEMRDVLKVAACFGSNVDETLIEYVLDRPVGAILDEAAAIGVLALEGAPGNFAFEHDGLQEAAYKLIPESSRELFHLEVGRRLWRRLNKEELDRNIFILLSQMNIGKRLITREKERYAIASLCLHAGKKAAKSSTFRTATVYLNLAIDLLGERAWRDEYDLTLAVHNAAAEMDMCTANFEAMDTLIESVLKHACSPSDKIQALSTQIYAMGVRDRQQEALDLGIDVLKGLGEHFPRRLGRRNLVAELKSVRKLLKGKSDEQLMRLPNIDDGDILACLQILNLMFLHALLVRPQLAPFVTLKLMTLTLTHGLSMIAPTAFATYGMLCISGMWDVDSGFRFGELGLELLVRLEVRAYLPRVYVAFYGCIHPWKRPLRDSLEPFLHAHRIGMQTGDMEFSSLNANMYCFVAMDAGVPLDVS